MFSHGVIPVGGHQRHLHIAVPARHHVDMIATGRPGGDEPQVRVICQKCRVDSRIDEPGDDLHVISNFLQRIDDADVVKPQRL